MAIKIKEIFASDTLSDIIEKLNFNFDQVTLNGGGLRGFKGIEGSQGLRGKIGQSGAQIENGSYPPINNPNSLQIIKDNLLNIQIGDYYLYLGSDSAVNGYSLGDLYRFIEPSGSIAFDDFELQYVGNIRGPQSTIDDIGGTLPALITDENSNYISRNRSIADYTINVSGNELTKAKPIILGDTNLTAVGGGNTLTGALLNNSESVNTYLSRNPANLFLFETYNSNGSTGVDITFMIEDQEFATNQLTRLQMLENKKAYIRYEKNDTEKAYVLNIVNPYQTEDDGLTGGGDRSIKGNILVSSSTKGDVEIQYGSNLLIRPEDDAWADDENFTGEIRLTSTRNSVYENKVPGGSTAKRGSLVLQHINKNINSSENLGSNNPSSIIELKDKEISLSTQKTNNPSSSLIAGGSNSIMKFNSDVYRFRKSDQSSYNYLVHEYENSPRAIRAILGDRHYTLKSNSETAPTKQFGSNAAEKLKDYIYNYDISNRLFSIKGKNVSGRGSQFDFTSDTLTIRRLSDLDNPSNIPIGDERGRLPYLQFLNGYGLRGLYVGYSNANAGEGAKQYTLLKSENNYSLVLDSTDKIAFVARGTERVTTSINTDNQASDFSFLGKELSLSNSTDNGDPVNIRLQESSSNSRGGFMKYYASGGNDRITLGINDDGPGTDTDIINIIRDNGRIGINTTTPTESFTLKDGIISIQNTNNSRILFNDDNDNLYGYVGYIAGSLTATDRMLFRHISNNSEFGIQDNGKIYISANGNGNAGITLSPAGKVSIGTYNSNNSAAKFTVSGDGYFTSTVSVANATNGRHAMNRNSGDSRYLNLGNLHDALANRSSSGKGRDFASGTWVTIAERPNTGGRGMSYTHLYSLGGDTSHASYIIYWGTNNSTSRGDIQIVNSSGGGPAGVLKLRIIQVQGGGNSYSTNKSELQALISGTRTMYTKNFSEGSESGYETLGVDFEPHVTAGNRVSIKEIDAAGIEFNHNGKLVIGTGNNVSINTDPGSLGLDILGSTRVRGTGDGRVDQFRITSTGYQSTFLWMDSSNNFRIDNSVNAGRDIIFNSGGNGKVSIGNTNTSYGNLSVYGDGPSEGIYIGNSGGNTFRIFKDVEKKIGYITRAGSTDKGIIIDNNGRIGIRKEPGTSNLFPAALNVGGSINSSSNISGKNISASVELQGEYLNLLNREKSMIPDTSGNIYYDVNISTTDDSRLSGSNLGGLRLYNLDDGWGTLLDTNNMPNIKANFASLTTSSISSSGDINTSGKYQIAGHDIKEYDSFVPENIGWYTIAENGNLTDKNSGNRAYGEFIIWDETSGRHQTISFTASYHYSNDPTIIINSRSHYSTYLVVSGIRMVYNSTYDGAQIQVRVDSNGTGNRIYVLKSNDIQNSGWKKKFSRWTSDISATGGPSAYKVIHKVFSETADDIVSATITAASSNYQLRNGDTTIGGDLSVSGNATLGNLETGNIDTSGWIRSTSTYTLSNLNDAEISLNSRTNKNTSNRTPFNNAGIITTFKGQLGFPDSASHTYYIRKYNTYQGNSSWERILTTGKTTHTIEGIIRAKKGSQQAGIYGDYDDSTHLVSHIWSMGSGYKVAADGSDYGNLYGMAYKYESARAGGHQIQFAKAGTVNAAIGLNGNYWSNGSIDISGNITANIVTASLNGNASTATKLNTARTIDGVSFDGTANITLPDIDTAKIEDGAVTRAKIAGSTTATITLNDNAYSGSAYTVPTLRISASGVVCLEGTGFFSDDFTSSNVIIGSISSSFAPNKTSKYFYSLNGSYNIIDYVITISTSGAISVRRINSSTGPNSDDEIEFSVCMWII